MNGRGDIYLEDGGWATLILRLNKCQIQVDVYGGQRRLNKVQIEIGSTDWKEQSSIIHFMGEHAL